MRINLKQTIKNYKGEDILESETKQVLTLSDVFVTALNTWLQNEQPTAEEKAKIYQLSIKTYSKDEVDYKVEDLSFIKERVGKVFNALVYGRVCNIIDSNNSK